MTIETICRRDPVTVDAGASLQDAAALMRREQVGLLVVVARAATLERPAVVVGVVTDRDLAVEVLGRGRDGSHVPVAALVSGRLVTIPRDASLSEAVATMEEEGVRRLIVTSDGQELLGVVSIDDIVEAWADDMAALARALRVAGDHEVGPAGTLGPQDRRIAVPAAETLVAWRHDGAAS
jgi:CBS domain-containing protein